MTVATAAVPCNLMSTSFQIGAALWTVAKFGEPFGGHHWILLKLAGYNLLYISNRE